MRAQEGIYPLRLVRQPEHLQFSNWDRAPDRGSVAQRSPVRPHEIPEIVAQHSPGRAHDPNLKIEGAPAAALSATDRFLLGRAFNDCTSVSLSSLTGGRSGTVFSIEATFRDSRAGPRPLPFFAKIDDTKKVDTEHEKYRDYATYHIPFNLRPNLDSSRCILGAQ